MKTLKIISCTCFVLLSLGCLAEKNTGVNLYESKMYSASKVYFQKQLNNAAATPEEKAETYYYLGEIYFKLNQPDSALLYYKKGLEASEAYAFNKIGTSKLTLIELTNKKALTKELKKTIEDTFQEAIKTNKKDIRLPLAVAEAYAAAGEISKAEEYIKKAKKVDAKNGLPYLLEGDILFSQNNFGEAGTKYENAIYFSPDLIGAYLKHAQLYTSLNSAVSLEKLMQAQGIAPDFGGIYCLLGEIYEKQGNSKEAVQHYAKFINDGYYEEEHLFTYAKLLYLDKQYDKVLPVVMPVLQKHPDNLVAQRLQAYALSKTQQGEQSINAIKQFVQNTPVEKLIYLDYLCYAEQLEENKQYAAAAENYKKAMQKDDLQKTLLQDDIAEMYEKHQQPDSAIKYYSLYLTQIGKQDSPTYFNIGRNYYTKGVDSDIQPEQRTTALQKADSMFTIVTELSPTSSLGYFWRARTNSMLDPETTLGLAKPFYEKVIEITTGQPEKYKNQLIESYKYLGYYYYVQADVITKKHKNNPDFAKEEYNQAKSFFQKVLDLDPNDAIAQKGIEIDIK
jgi:tetratricopeptide (TPR) repeat protein